MKRVYISGPMSDISKSNFPVFNAAAASLRALGLEVVNPAEINPGDPPPEGSPPEAFKAFWHACLRADLKELMDCDTLALLPGWENSSGAHLELHNAHRTGIKVTTVSDILNGAFKPGAGA